MCFWTATMRPGIMQSMDFYNCGYRTLQEDAVPYIFPFDKSKHAKKEGLHAIRNR